MTSNRVHMMPGWWKDRVGGPGCYLHDTGVSVCKMRDLWQAWTPGRIGQSKMVGTRKTRNAAMRLALSANKEHSGGASASAGAGVGR
ncbi:MAG TPA: hypothetical protein PKE26_11805 [Kiritimatiellia bacterium]|nr:hypothetical protein [Kiritimatiellia bacterium]